MTFSDVRLILLFTAVASHGSKDL